MTSSTMRGGTAAKRCAPRDRYGGGPAADLAASHASTLSETFPSSKTCSTCGTLRTDLTLKDRTFECHSCGQVMDRDLNAAVNLAAWAEDHTPTTRQALPRMVAGVVLPGSGTVKRPAPSITPIDRTPPPAAPSRSVAGRD